MAFFSLVVGCLMYMIENEGTCVVGKNCDQVYPFPNGSYVRLQAVTEEMSTIPTSMQVPSCSDAGRDGTGRAVAHALTLTTSFAKPKHPRACGSCLSH